MWDPTSLTTRFYDLIYLGYHHMLIRLNDPIYVGYHMLIRFYDPIYVGSHMLVTILTIRSMLVIISWLPENQFNRKPIQPKPDPFEHWKSLVHKYCNFVSLYRRKDVLFAFVNNLKIQWQIKLITLGGWQSLINQRRFPRV